MIKINITWPAAILILVAVLIWLTRQPAAQSVTTRDQSQRPHPRRQRPARSPREAQPFIIIDQHQPTGQRDGARPMTYAEALNDPTLTPEQMSAIGNAEALAAARESIDPIRPNTRRTPAWR